jgi:hypothetical protein
VDSPLGARPRRARDAHDVHIPQADEGVAINFASGMHAFLDRLEARLDGEHVSEWMGRVAELRKSTRLCDSAPLPPRINPSGGSMGRICGGPGEIC